MSGELILQGVWDWILQKGGKYVQHWLFPGWVTMGVYIMICLYFTIKDLCRANSKIQKDYWPSVKDMLVAAIPQIVIYFSLNAIFSYFYPIYLSLPAQAPSLFTFFTEIAICFVVGDFLIYWEHRIMHMIPFLRIHIHSVHHSYHAPVCH